MGANAATAGLAKTKRAAS